MHLAEMRKRHVADLERARTARVIPWRRLGRGLHRADRPTGRFERRQRIGLGVIGIHFARFLGPMARRLALAQARRDQGLIVGLGAGILRADLEQRGVRHAAIGIALRRAQQIADDRRPHRVEIGADRIGEQDRAAIPREEQWRILGAHERPGDRLEHAARRERATREPRAALLRRDRLMRQAARRHADRRDLVVAVDAQDLLDEIGLAFRIHAPGRNRHGPAFAGIVRRLVAERAEDALRLGGRHREAAQRLEALRPERHAALPFRHRARRDDLARLAAAAFGDELRRDLRAPEGAFGIDAALEAIARIGLDAELAPRRRDAHAVEQRHFEEHVLRFGRAAGELTAHDAADAVRALRIGDHRDRRVEFVGLAVERQDLLALARRAHREIAGELVRVEDVQRPPEIVGDEIRDIDERADGPEADRHEAALHPLRARAVRDVAEVAADDERTGVVLGLLDLPDDGTLECPFHRLHRPRLQRADAHRREIARDAADTERIGPVRRDRDLDDGIAKIHQFDIRLADRRIGREVDDALVIVGKAELALGEQHAVRFDAADDALLEVELRARDMRAGRRVDALHALARVRRTTHDLDRRALADIDLADAELVGVRVLRALRHVADDERRERFRLVLDAFDLEAAARQRLVDRLDRRGGFEMVLEPAERELHWPSPPTSEGTSSGTKP